MSKHKQTKTNEESKDWLSIYRDDTRPVKSLIDEQIDKTVDKRLPLRSSGRLIQLVNCYSYLSQDFPTIIEEIPQDEKGAFIEFVARQFINDLTIYTRVFSPEQIEALGLLLRNRLQTDLEIEDPLEYFQEVNFKHLINE